MATKQSIALQHAVTSFINLTGKGWETELAARCCHDTVHNEITLDEFLVACQKAAKAKVAKVGKIVTKLGKIK